ncbi:MAG: DUF4249 domain-containing protein [Bacteroidota bacterium]
MKKTFQFLIFGFTILFLSSCEDVIQIKLDEGAKLYVIDAFVNDLRGPQSIRVVTNDSYFSNRDAPPVTNATVVLKDLSINKIYSFSYTERGYYVFNQSTTDTISKKDHQYELNVTIDGETYTSLTTQKRTAKIDSISATYDDGTSGFGPPTPYYYCTLYAKDRADNNPDYYWVKAARNDTMFNGPGDINLCIDGTGGVVTGLDVDSTDFTPPSTFIGFRQYNSGNTCKVEIHSISRATYFFLLQALTQINNGGLFATTPENVKTNIVNPTGAKTKAIGWFNMASVAVMTKIVP